VRRYHSVFSFLPSRRRSFPFFSSVLVHPSHDLAFCSGQNRVVLSDLRNGERHKKRMRTKKTFFYARKGHFFAQQTSLIFKEIPFISPNGIEC